MKKSEKRKSGTEKEFVYDVRNNYLFYILSCSKIGLQNLYVAFRSYKVGNILGKSGKFGLD